MKPLNELKVSTLKRKHKKDNQTNWKSKRKRKL